MSNRLKGQVSLHGSKWKVKWSKAKLLTWLLHSLELVACTTTTVERGKGNKVPCITSFILCSSCPSVACKPMHLFPITCLLSFASEVKKYIYCVILGSFHIYGAQRRSRRMQVERETTCLGGARKSLPYWPPMIKRRDDIRIRGGRIICICVHLGSLSNGQIRAILSTGNTFFFNFSIACMHTFQSTLLFSTGFVNDINGVFLDKGHKIRNFFFMFFAFFLFHSKQRQLNVPFAQRNLENTQRG